MPIDRAATLRNAEKLIRQGRLDQAIEDYLRLVEDQPHDWNTANLLGDLYVRAGQIERAVDCFLDVAGMLDGQGSQSRANALYKKILKVDPNHEGALLKAAAIARSQGLLADAGAYLTRIAHCRQARGDVRGAEEIARRLAALRPVDTMQDQTEGPETAETDTDAASAGLAGSTESPESEAHSPEARPEVVATAGIHPAHPVAASSDVEAVEILTSYAAQPRLTERIETRSQVVSTNVTTAPPALGNLASVQESVSVPERLDPSDQDLEVDLTAALEDLTIFGFVSEVENPTDGAETATVEVAREEAQPAAAESAQNEVCIQALLAASRAPGFLFRAATLLGRTHQEQGKVLEAIEWFERAAREAAPTVAEGHALLYDLAMALESVGEFDRALAVGLGLQADAGDFRNLASLVDRLGKDRARG